MVAWAQREPGVVYPAWWEKSERLIARRLREMNYAHTLSEADGLPPGMTIKKNTNEFKVWVEGVGAHRQQFTNRVEVAAHQLAQWIEEYRQDKETERIMGVSQKGLDLLKELARAGGTMKRALVTAHGAVINAAEKNGLVDISVDGKNVGITAAGIDVLRGLPEFDEPISAPTEETSPPAPLLEERGEEQSVDKPVVTVTLNGNTAPEQLEAFAAVSEGTPNVDDRLVRIVMADGIELEAVVKHCGSEIMGLGGTVIKLQLSEALLREIYPPLVKFLEGHNAIGVRYSVLGDLQIVIERPLEDSNEPIPFGLT